MFRPIIVNTCSDSGLGIKYIIVFIAVCNSITVEWLYRICDENFEVEMANNAKVNQDLTIEDVDICENRYCSFMPLAISDSEAIGMPNGNFGTRTFITEIVEPDNANVTWRIYYPGGGLRVQTDSTSNLSYLVQDHLNSTSLTLNSSGGVIGEKVYSAWGETRFSFGAIPTDRLYTGQYEAEVGLYFYNARWYDNQLGRFAQADIIIPEPYNVLDWDRYQYVRSNPINLIDPSGHDVDCGIGEGGCRRRVRVEKAERFLSHLIDNKETIIWDELSKQEQKILTDVGWNLSSFDHSDYVLPSVKNISGTAQDPLIWLVTLISAGRISTSAIAITKNLLNSVNIVNLYRAVGVSELTDIINNGLFRPDPSGKSMNGKWFTNSVYLADLWGQKFSNWTGVPTTVDQIGVPKSLLNQMQYISNLDGIGQAWYAEGPVLNTLNQFCKYINIIH